MDDSISDDINVVSSDEELEISDEVVDDEDDGVEVVDVSFEGDGAAIHADRESPGNDEVVVVDEGVVNLVEDSDDQDQETSEDEDSRGQEEEGEGGEEEAGNGQPASPLLLSGASSSPLQQPSPPTQQDGQDPPSPPSPPTPSPPEQLASPPPSNDLPVPGVSLSPTTPTPRPSLPHNPNSSMDDFQTPVIHRPVLSAALAAARSNESIAEFRSPKRRRIGSPEKASHRGGETTKDKTSGDGGDGDREEDDGNCCSICFEPWDNSGRHRLAALKCGHLFGLGCIEKWLRGQGGKCPSCNNKAKMKDIRVIYAKAIKMVDTTERDRALQHLEREREGRRRAELQAAQLRLQCRQCNEETGRLREEVTRLKAELSLRSSTSVLPSSQSGRPLTFQSQPPPLQGHFTHHKTVRVFEGGQCRVVTHCPSMGVLVISQPSPNNLFPGFGIKKLSCMDFKTASYLTLHQKQIRGLAFHHTLEDGLLLSAAMDKTVKLTSIHTNSVVQTYNVEVPLWSCEWNADNHNCFYAGQQNGTVLEFDTRNTATHLREMNTEGSKSPVVALQHMARDVNSTFKLGGVVVGQLNRVSFFESKGGNENTLHILPLEGNLTSVNVDRRTRHLLASFRPSTKCPTVKHQLCELTSTAGQDGTEVSCHVVESYQGGQWQSVLAQSVLMSHPADPSRLLVVAGDQPSESTQVWDSGTSQVLQRLPCHAMPLDFAPFHYNNSPFLAALTDKTLMLHRWN